MSSCCRDAPDRHTYYGADIYPAKKDSVQISDYKQTSYFLEVKALYSTIAGKSCPDGLPQYKVSALPIVDESIPYDKVKIYCNTNIVLTTKTINANENLLSYPDYISLSGDNGSGGFYGTIIGFRPDPADSFVKGTYTFYITGSTDKNRTFADSASVVFY
ncbi:hypothetical protein CAP35_13560 [Chitinophagaceae bacterium IBVUCB1]|nr:hypothetical protein CAP35_13560 [Chitinophagaceae bacterium IBVUCB1]